jgi:hypothetical protein
MEIPIKIVISKFIYEGAVLMLAEDSKWHSHQEAYPINQ